MKENLPPSEIVKLHGYQSVKHLSDLSGIKYQSLRRMPKKNPEKFMQIVKTYQRRLSHDGPRIKDL